MNKKYEQYEHKYSWGILNICIFKIWYFLFGAHLNLDKPYFKDSTSTWGAVAIVLGSVVLEPS